MIGLYVIAGLVVVLVAIQPLLSRIGQRRLERDALELQALHGQITSELRAEAYYRSRA